jgi:small neutral amino acid transporter SnatA (MarC family)
MYIFHNIADFLNINLEYVILGLIALLLLANPIYKLVLFKTKRKQVVQAPKQKTMHNIGVVFLHHLFLVLLGQRSC